MRAHWSPDRPWLLMVGTLEPRKNHAAALHALRRLADEGFPHRLLIVGGQGWLFEPISALVDELDLRERVVFTGYVPYGGSAATLRGGRLLAMPSLYEGFGFPLLEAMACAAPRVPATSSACPKLVATRRSSAHRWISIPLRTTVRLVLAQPALAQELALAGVCGRSALPLGTMGRDRCIVRGGRGQGHDGMVARPGRSAFGSSMSLTASGLLPSSSYRLRFRDLLSQAFTPANRVKPHRFRPRSPSAKPRSIASAIARASSGLPG